MLFLRLSGRKTCERVKEKGFLWKGKHFIVRYLPGIPRNLRSPSPLPAIYVGTLTSTKLHKSAVKRNRMRRRCREALRLAVRSLMVHQRSDQRSAISDQRAIAVSGVALGADRRPQTADRFFQLLLLPRSSSLSAAFGELLADADRLLLFLTQRARRHFPQNIDR